MMSSPLSHPLKHLLKDRVPTILQVLPGFSSGGVETECRDIAFAIKRHGWNVIVASSGGAKVASLEDAGIIHLTLPIATKNPLAIYQNRKLIAKIIRAYDVDIVHARSRAPAWSCYLACRETRTPFVTTFHGSYGTSGLGKIRYNSVMALGDRVIAISEYIESHIKHHYQRFIAAKEQSPIRLIQRGVDCNQFKPSNVSTERLRIMTSHLKIPDGVPIITLPGRFTHIKGHMLLLEALQQLKAEHIDFFCVFVGEPKRKGHFLKRINKAIHQMGLRNDVQIMPSVSDMPALYMVSDVVISTSTIPEAFGRIPIEAGAMERLVIASNLGGPKETIIPGRTGWLIDPTSPKELAEALKQAISLPAKDRERMTKAARAHIEKNFSLEQMCNRTIDVYEGILKETI